MKANELRIGNLLFDQKNRHCIVDKIWKDNYRALSINESITTLPNKPIPITEEWLLKFGFENKGTEEDWDLFQLKNVVVYKTIILGFIFDYDNGNEYVKINSVHQLQNLYFALTNEELTIKN